MVEVMEYTKGMRCLHIEVRVILCSFVSIPIELCQRIISCGMIINHIQNNCHAGLMTSVNELLIHSLCSIRFVHRKEEARIIAPAIIAVKFLHRHQFNGIDTHFLQIRKFTHCSIDVAGSGKITQVQFINNQFFGIGNLEIIHLPVVIVLLNLESRNNASSAFRIGHILIISRSRYVRVIIRVKYLLSISIRQSNHFTGPHSDVILESVFFIGIQSL